MQAQQLRLSHVSHTSAESLRVSWRRNRKNHQHSRRLAPRNPIGGCSSRGSRRIVRSRRGHSCRKQLEYRKLVTRNNVTCPFCPMCRCRIWQGEHAGISSFYCTLVSQLVVNYSTIFPCFLRRL